MACKKQIYRILSCLLAVTIIFSTLPFSVLTALAEEVGDVMTLSAGNTTEFAGGTGSASDPYLISTKEHLNNVRNYLGACFKMMANLEFTEEDFAKGGQFYNNGQGWEPIGTNQNASFTGMFDGNKHTIKGLKISIASNRTVCAGLFGYNQGVISNLGMLDGNVNATSPYTKTDTASCAYAGGIAGSNSGTISSCYNMGSVNATSADVYADAHAGGIAGYNKSGIISNCYNTGSVRATSFDSDASSYAGGIAGYSKSGTISSCYNTGSVRVTIIFCTYAGGIAGFNDGGTVSSCYYLDRIEKGCGKDSTDGTVQCTEKELRLQQTFIGFDFDSVWTMEGNKKYPYPELQSAKHVMEEKKENTSEFAGGTGELYNPYLISTKEHLNNVRNYLGACFKMMANLEFTEEDFAKGGQFYNNGQGWEPIGTDQNASFAGMFDGDNHTIKGLKITKESEEMSYAGSEEIGRTGLFGYNKGDISNLGMLDGNISINITSWSYAGGIAGLNDGGTISNCYNTGSVRATSTSPSISSSYIAVAGGIAGANSGIISDCYNAGSVSSDDYAGGIAGAAGGIITDCYNAGSVRATAYSSLSFAGGIAGSNSGTISSCYNTGNVSSDDYAGGIAGYNYETISNCYYLDSISKGCGEGSTDGTVQYTEKELRLQQTFVGFDFDFVWTMEGDENYPYPELQSVKHVMEEKEENISEFAGGTGELHDPYLISTKEHLNNVRNYLNACFKMTHDIKFTAEDFAEDGAFDNNGCGWIPIGRDKAPFTGIFDGDGHTIQGLVVDTAGCAGLFGHVKEGTIRNVGIAGGNIHAVSVVSGECYAGGIAGYNYGGLISDCYNTGSVRATAWAGGIAGYNYGTISSCYNTGNVSNGHYAGGIVGYNSSDGKNRSGLISSCYNTGSVSAASTSSKSDADANANAGGIAGHYNYGTISNCYNTGSVSAASTSSKSDADANAGGIAGYKSGYGTISSCYNTGSVSAASTSSKSDAYTGGIVGGGYVKNTSNCYYLDSISHGCGNYSTSGTVRCTEAELRQQQTFAGFDFNSVWTMEGIETYPYPELRQLPMKVPLSPPSPALSSKTNVSVTLTPTDGCEYRMDKGQWQRDNVFRNLAPNSTHKFYQRVAETDTTFASDSSPALTVTTDKSANSTIPIQPKLVSKTDTSVTLQSVPDYEYSNGGENWQDDPTFHNLQPGQEYQFYQRVKETETQKASVTSAALSVTTEKSTNSIVPEQPKLESKTDTSATLQSIPGYEYSNGGSRWQDSPTFNNLQPGRKYKFYQRVKETETTKASATSVALSVTTDKSTVAAPATPTLSGKTDTTVTLKATAGYEYKMDEGQWQTDNVFRNLAPNSTHSFYQRVAETATAKASDPSLALTVTTEKSANFTIPAQPKLASKTDTAVTLNATDGYEYRMDEGLWQKEPFFSGLLPNSTHSFYQRVAETDTTNASAASSPLTVTTDKSTGSAPAAPTVSSKTDKTVTLKATAGYEYKMDEGQWQTDNVFRNLAPNSTHSFYQRVKETETTKASASSDALSVTTDKSTVAAPAAPTLSGKTDTTVTLKPTAGYEYKMDEGQWQKDNVFRNLAPNSTHSFYQRVKETETTKASASSDALSVTTDKSTVAAPAQPKVASKTQTSVTLQTVPGCEYSRDGSHWQSSPTFDGLQPDQEYTFYQRYKETGTAKASEKSAALTVRTDPEYIPGDVNGDGTINSADGLLLKRYLNKWGNLDIESPKALDFDGNGTVNSADALLLMRYLNGWK